MLPARHYSSAPVSQAPPSYFLSGSVPWWDTSPLLPRSLGGMCWHRIPGRREVPQFPGPSCVWGRDPWEAALCPPERLFPTCSVCPRPDQTCPGPAAVVLLSLHRAQH